MPNQPDYKKILLQLCASLTQVDHMGAAWDEVRAALELAGINAGGGAADIARVLGEMEITTLNGTALSGGYEPYYS